MDQLWTITLDNRLRKNISICVHKYVSYISQYLMWHKVNRKDNDFYIWCMVCSWKRLFLHQDCHSSNISVRFNSGVLIDVWATFWKYKYGRGCSPFSPILKLFQYDIVKILCLIDLYWSSSWSDTNFQIKVSVGIAYTNLVSWSNCFFWDNLGRHR